MHAMTEYGGAAQLQVTRRGVLWVGLKCDVRCKFCYDDRIHPRDKIWLPLEQAIEALNKFRYFYKNEFVDFMGGEPTLHPRMLEIVHHASSIGLRPTIITHGMHLADPALVQKYKQAGIGDFLVSIHGIGATARQIHMWGTDNFEKQMTALRALKEAGIPFRFNCVPIKDNLDQLIDVVALAAQTGARVVNFLTFNPYFEWAKEGHVEFQVSHSSAAPHLSAAIKLGESLGVEVNVRYFPICMLPGYEKNVYTGFQLPYDPHEWDYNSWYDQKAEAVPIREWYSIASEHQRRRHNYVHPSACTACAARSICDGGHSQYFSRWGDSELRPVSGAQLSDPCHFTQHQEKHRYAAGAEDLRATHLSMSRLTATQFDGSLNNRAGIRTK